MISEETLRQLSRDERAAVSRALAALDAGPDASLDLGDHRRRRFATLMTIASLALIPWIVLLGLTLPHRYVAGHWTLTWVGFDVLLLTSLAATSWLAWRRRRIVVLAAFATATLLMCDAWFDITTATGRTDTLIAVATAVLLELPFAAVLCAVATHLFQRDSRRLGAAIDAADAVGSLAKPSLLSVPDGGPRQPLTAPVSPPTIRR